MNSEYDVDVAIIGGGTAGLNARREAVKYTDSVLMIEGGPWGTTCARVGCMPSKLLIAAAEAVHRMEGADLFGIRAREGVEVDGKAVMSRVGRERDRFVGFVVRAVQNLPDEQRLRGYASFESQNRLRVELEGGGEAFVNAKAVVIATGSSTWYPPVFEGAEDRLIVNDDVFDWEDLPESVAVAGAGVIGIELGQALHRLGVRVALYDIDERVGRLTDHVVNQKAKQVFGAELDLRLGSNITHVRRSDGGVLVSWRGPRGQQETEEFEYFLAVTGRRPNLSRLNLENAGVELDDRGVPVFDGRTMQICDSPIFIAGDVTGERVLLHEASDEGHTAGENAARYPEVIAHRRRTRLAIVFSDPQVALVGKTYQELVDSEEDFGVGEVSYDDQGRARVMGLNQGHVRIYARRECGTLLGAEMLGPRVEHTGHLLAWAIQSGMTVVDALSMPFYHPVIEEGIRTALRDLAADIKMELAADPLAYGPGV